LIEALIFKIIKGKKFSDQEFYSLNTRKTKCLLVEAVVENVDGIVVVSTLKHESFFF
jgi:hypothetical protein